MSELIRASSNKYGTTYRLKTPVIFTVNNTKTIFGIEDTGKYGRYVKWIYNNSGQLFDFHDFLKKIYINHDLKSPVILRENYPTMIQTKIPTNKNVDIISSDDGDISTINDFINKNTKYNLILEVKNIFVSNEEIKYSVYIKKIEIAF